MSRYIGAELRRIFSKKANLITIAVILGIIFLLDIIMFKGFNYSKSEIMVNYGIESVEAASDETGELLSVLAFNAICATSGFVILILSSFVMGDEIKERAYLRLYEAGLGRGKIVLSKYILSIAVSFIMLVLVLAVHFLNIGIMFGLNRNELILLKEFGKIFLLYLVPLLNLLALSEFLFLAFSQEWLVGLLYVITGLMLPGMLRGIFSMAGYSGKILDTLLSLHPGSVISGLNANLMTFTFESRLVNLSDLMSGMLLKITANGIMALIIILLSIAVLKRRNLG